MWNKLFEKQELWISCEPTTYCNAGCPQCSRTNATSGKKEVWLPEKSWTIEDFKQMFPKETFRGVEGIVFGGTYGDPMMCPDIMEMCRHVIESDDKCRVVISTNGSTRTEQWYWDLGVLCGDRLNVVFAIDGSTQEMHVRYRRNTNLEKILDNLEALASTMATARVFTVLFDHNIHHLEEIQEMTRQRGATNWEHTPSGGFGREENSLSYVSPDGEAYTLDRIIATDIPEDWDKSRVFVTAEQYKKWDAGEFENPIPCTWYENKNIYVMNSGIVWPCCHTSRPYEAHMMGWPVRTEHEQHSRAWDPIFDDTEKFMLQHYTLEEIINNDFYGRALEESLRSPKTADPICALICGKS